MDRYVYTLACRINGDIDEFTVYGGLKRAHAAAEKYLQKQCGEEQDFWIDPPRYDNGSPWYDPIVSWEGVCVNSGTNCEITIKREIVY